MHGVIFASFDLFEVLLEGGLRLLFKTVYYKPQGDHYFFYVYWHSKGGDTVRSCKMSVETRRGRKNRGRDRNNDINREQLQTWQISF